MPSVFNIRQHITVDHRRNSWPDDDPRLQQKPVAPRTILIGPSGILTARLPPRYVTLSFCSPAPAINWLNFRHFRPAAARALVDSTKVHLAAEQSRAVSTSYRPICRPVNHLRFQKHPKSVKRAARGIMTLSVWPFITLEASEPVETSLSSLLSRTGLLNRMVPLRRYRNDRRMAHRIDYRDSPIV